MENNKLTLLINTSDGFEDCWQPFFKLFSTYWESFSQPILLNTEFKDFHYSGLNITSAKSHINEKKRRLTWSECLINALNKVETPLVLYMQEDYFVEQEVNHFFIDEVTDLMLKNTEIKYIGLTDTGNYPPFFPWEGSNRLTKVSQKSKYRISTQAAIWRKETLLSYLRANENGWMFEIFGTKRANKRNELFLTVNRAIFNYKHNPVIAYTHTGIIKSKWHPKIPALFNKHQIEMDFDKRGFYKKKHIILRKIETAKMLLKKPSLFIKVFLNI